MRATAWKVVAQLAALGATVAEGLGAGQEWAAAMKEAATLVGSMAAEVLAVWTVDEEQQEGARVDQLLVGCC